jgi:hypothetical protein
VQQVLQAHKDRQVHKVFKVTLVQLVQQAHKVFRVFKVTLAQQVQLDQQVRLQQ